MINARGGQPPSEGTVGSKKRASLWLAIGRRTAVSCGSARRAAPISVLRPEETRCLRTWAVWRIAAALQALLSIEARIRLAGPCHATSHSLGVLAEHAVRRSLTPSTPPETPNRAACHRPDAYRPVRPAGAGRPRTPFERVALGARWLVVGVWVALAAPLGLGDGFAGPLKLSRNP